ncbi:MAG: hypothetical protein HN368_06335 [Spirochaetales bacterium]|nr:hypothetical protein [Spirochaetales bacterium]
MANSPTAVDEAALFSFDDVSIPHAENLRLIMNSPAKYSGNPVLEIGAPGCPDNFGVQFYGSIIRHAGKYKLWYVAFDDDINTEGHEKACRPAYAESEDGITWQRPDLSLVEYRGNKSNNLLLIEPAPVNAINLKVIIDPDDPDPSRLFKMAAETFWYDNGVKSGGTLCPLFSADGLRWQIANGVTPVDQRFTKKQLFLPPIHFEAAGGLHTWKGMYYISGQGTDQNTSEISGRKISLFRSADFLTWQPTSALAFVREGQHGDFATDHGEETHEGVSVWHRGNVLLGLYGIWHGGRDWPEHSIDLGFLVSNDGTHFREPAVESVFIRRGDDGEWDQGGLIQGQGFENVGDETYIWYGAWDPRFHSPFRPRGGLGLAILERDRFGALTPYKDGRASLVTSDLQLEGPGSLFLNASGLSKDSRLTVELLDGKERGVPGYSGEHAISVTQSGLQVPVRSDGRMINFREPFKIRICFEGSRSTSAKLYAIYLVSKSKK